MNKTAALMAHISGAQNNSTIDMIGSQAFKQKIISDIQSHYSENIKHAMFWKTEWYKITTGLHTTSEVLLIISVILAFLAGSSVIGEEYVSICALVSGGLGVISRSLELFSKSTKKNSQKKTDELNELLGGLGIDHRVPDIANDYNSVEGGSQKDSEDEPTDGMTLGDVEMGFLKNKPLSESKNSI